MSMSNAFVLINCERNQKEYVLENLEKIKNVEYVDITMGAYDMVVKLKGENENVLRETIMNKIKSVKKINHTIALMNPLRK